MTIKKREMLGYQREGNGRGGWEEGGREEGATAFSWFSEQNLNFISFNSIKRASRPVG